MSDHICRTCRWWDMHSQDMPLGDCRAPDDHRYWRGQFGGNKPLSFLMDSFGREETKPGYSCGAWSDGMEPKPPTSTMEG